MEEFSRDIYKVDVLKVEFPVDARFVEGSSVFSGRRPIRWPTRLGFYREADRIARRPYVYLSAGVSGAQFLDPYAWRAKRDRNSRACCVAAPLGAREFPSTRETDLKD